MASQQVVDNEDTITGPDKSLQIRGARDEFKIGRRAVVVQVEAVLLQLLGRAESLAGVVHFYTQQETTVLVEREWRQGGGRAGRISTQGLCRGLRGRMAFGEQAWDVQPGGAGRAPSERPHGCRHFECRARGVWLGGLEGRSTLEIEGEDVVVEEQELVRRTGVVAG